MRSKLLLLVAFTATAAFGRERMSISVCNIGEIPDKTVARAEKLLAAVFSPADVEVTWTNCDEWGPGVPILFRLRRGKPLHSKRADSLDVMGMAFIGEGGPGLRADAYYDAIERFAAANQADPAEILTYVMAHEIGHQLLGPGHSPGSIMTAVWDSKALVGLGKHWLAFNNSQRTRIHSELRARMAMAEHVNTR